MNDLYWIAPLLTSLAVALGLGVIALGLVVVLTGRGPVELFDDLLELLSR